MRHIPRMASTNVDVLEMLLFVTTDGKEEIRLPILRDSILLLGVLSIYVIVLHHECQ